MTKFITRSIAVLGVVAGIGVAALPAMSYAASQDVELSVTVQSTLSGEPVICRDGVTPATIGAGASTTLNCEISYQSNGAATVSIKDADETLNLVSGDNTIKPISAAAADVTGEGWGYKFTVDNAGADSGGLTATNDQYNPITASDFTVASNDAPLTSAATGTFGFKVSTQSNTEAGTYKDTVTISITADN